MQMTTDRMMHSYGVAMYMYDHALDFGLEPDEMFFLGLNHDIGYVEEKKNHEERGAELLESIIGDRTELTDAIYWHGSTPYEYMNEENTGEFGIPKPLVLLWRADMTISSKGEEVGYDKRLGGILERYGRNSDAYMVCKTTITWLKTHPEISEPEKYF